MIQTTRLSKVFGPIRAVDRLDLTIESGEVLGFLGPNGAGKSTTMKMVTGFLRPSAGKATVGGIDVAKDPIAARKQIGYLPEGAPAYPDMTPEGFLRFVCSVRQIKGRDAKRRIDDVADRVRLRGVMRQPIETLSKGYKRRVGLAQSIIHDPPVLILDEPTDGLDPNQKHEVRELIKDMAGRKCVVLSTHILEEVEAVCTRAVIIARGKLVADGTPAELRSRASDHNTVTVGVRGETEGFLDALRKIPGVDHVDRLGGDREALRCLVVPDGNIPIAPDVGRLARERGLQLEEFTVEPGRLDTVFRDLTAPKTPAGKPEASPKTDKGAAR